MTLSDEPSARALRELARSFRSGPLSIAVTNGGFRQAIGVDPAEPVKAVVERFVAAGMAPAQIAVALEAMAEIRGAVPDAAQLIELVMSGPEVLAAPASDTRATMDALIASATSEMFLVGYAVHNGADLFEPLARRMAAVEALKVIVCLDIPRRPNDTSLATEVVRRFASEFRTKHWPWSRLPELYYDPRALSPSQSERASLHAKCVIADGKSALITSANFTEAAQRRNIEAGVLVSHRPLVGRLRSYFAAGIQTGWLRQCQFGT